MEADSPRHETSKVRSGITSALAVGGIVAAALIISSQLRPNGIDQQTRIPPATQLPAPRAVTDAQRASAAVNEEYSWGLEIEGLNLRSAPLLAAEPIGGRVVHGELYEIVCWVQGERVTNGNDDNPTDDATTYTSTLWWKIDGPEAEAFISDVWFARSNGDILGTQGC